MNQAAVSALMLVGGQVTKIAPKNYVPKKPQKFYIILVTNKFSHVFQY